MVDNFLEQRCPLRSTSMYDDNSASDIGSDIVE